MSKVLSFSFAAITSQFKRKLSLLYCCQNFFIHRNSFLSSKPLETTACMKWCIKHWTRKPLLPHLSLGQIVGAGVALPASACILMNALRSNGNSCYSTFWAIRWGIWLSQMIFFLDFNSSASGLRQLPGTIKLKVKILFPGHRFCLELSLAFSTRQYKMKHNKKTCVNLLAFVLSLVYSVCEDVFFCQIRSAASGENGK